MDVTKLLTFAVQVGASDVHLSSGQPPLIRLHGDMQKLDHPSLSRDEVHNLVYDIMDDNQRKVYEKDLELDFSFDMGETGRFRVNVFMQQRGKARCFELFRPRSSPLTSWGFPTFCRPYVSEKKVLCW